MVGDRIRQARLASGLTLAEVAEQLKAVDQPITAAGLSKYEHNKSMPSAAFLLKLAGVLGVKSSSFLQEPEARVQWLAFRKHSTLPARKQEQIQAAAFGVAEGQFRLQHTLYPDERPQLPAPRRVQTAEDAEAAASQLRKTWQLGRAPVESITQAAEDHGAIVVGWRDAPLGFDGLAGWMNHHVPVAVVNLRASDDRRRFNLAHELGHMLMVCDRVDNKAEERLTHRFASAFLVPAEAARHELGVRRRKLSLAEIGLLKQKYGLSMQAWVRRARDLEIIDEGYYNTWCIEFSSRGWRKEEPYSYVGQEEPLRLKQMVLHALAEGIITEERALELCPECVERQPASLPEGRTYTARELMQLTRAQRERILAAAASEAGDEYGTNPELTEFEAFGEGDLYDEYPESEQG